LLINKPLLINFAGKSVQYNVLQMESPTKKIREIRKSNKSEVQTGSEKTVRTTDLYD